MLGWRYSPPYDLYNLTMTGAAAADLVRFLADPANQYYALLDAAGDLVAYCCFGADAQVPGGDYTHSALDIGLGVRPDLTGHGLGGRFVAAVLAFAAQTFPPAPFRVTIAVFNQRAQRVWAAAGFRPVQTFTRPSDNMPFVILVRD